MSKLAKALLVAFVLPVVLSATIFARDIVLNSSKESNVAFKQETIEVLDSSSEILPSENHVTVAEVNNPKERVTEYVAQTATLVASESFSAPLATPSRRVVASTEPTAVERVVETTEPVTVVETTEAVVVAEVKPTTTVENGYTLVNRGTPRTSTGTFKTYMDYRAITNKASAQYKLQQKCVTDNLGFRIYDGKYYTVAMGTYYAKYVGQKFKVTLDGGKEIYVMIGDVKQNIHTNKTHQHSNSANGNILEFIVDTTKMDVDSKRAGDVSKTDGDILKGAVIKIEEITE